jgi:phospholipid/cholesterol/gamma-HCH transport system ATP-binding protein
MRKRAGLARAMALDPELLFFDEPSSGLDPVLAADLDRLILRLRETLGATMVIVTHDLDSILAVADRVILVDRQTKGIIATGDPRALTAGESGSTVHDFFTRSGLRRVEPPPGTATP